MPRKPSQHVDNPKAVGRRLREARERAGLTQRGLAFDGCTAAYISRVEKGERVPSLQILKTLARKLEVTAEFLATGSNEPDELDVLAEAELAARLGETERAERLYRESIETAVEAEVRARSAAGIGQLAFERGDHVRAIELLSEVLDGGLLPTPDAADVADRLGRAYALTGEFETALAIFERFLGEAKEREDLVDEVRFTVLVANVLVDNGNLPRAAEVLARAVDAARNLRDPLARARVLWSQSRLHILQNRPDLAMRYARQALETLQLTDHSLYIARTFQLLAHIANDRGEPEEALALLEEGYGVVDAGGNRFEAATFKLERARALLRLNRREQAAAEAMEAVGVVADASPTDAGRGYTLIADVFREIGDSAKALELYELAAEVLPGADRYLIDVYSAMAQLLEEAGKKDEALGMLKKALGLQQRAGVTPRA